MPSYRSLKRPLGKPHWETNPTRRRAETASTIDGRSCHPTFGKSAGIGSRQWCRNFSMLIARGSVRLESQEPSSGWTCPVAHLTVAKGPSHRVPSNPGDKAFQHHRSRPHCRTWERGNGNRAAQRTRGIWPRVPAFPRGSLGNANPLLKLRFSTIPGFPYILSMYVRPFRERAHILIARWIELPSG